LKTNWDHLRFFNALASHGTLSEAARQLGVSHSTVQRHISAFEQELQVQLFYNATSGYKLTPAGHTLYTETADIQRTLLALSSRLANTDNELRGRVSITVSDTIGYFVVPDLLVSLYRAYPKIEFSVSVLNQLSNISDLEADIAIRTGDQPGADLIGRQTGTITFAVCASREYLATHTLTTDNALKNANDFIALDNSFDNASFFNWLPANLLQSEPADTCDKRYMTVNGFLSAWRLCSAGLGLALLPAYLLKHDSNLQQVNCRKLPKATPLWVLSHADLRDSNRTKAVRKHLIERLSVLFSTKGPAS
jgi:DNA-binding transcriptional LysR family regulator